MRLTRDELHQKEFEYYSEAIKAIYNMLAELVKTQRVNTKALMELYKDAYDRSNECEGGDDDSNNGNES